MEEFKSKLVIIEVPALIAVAILLLLSKKK
jgi:hypothetical protein